MRRSLIAVAIFAAACTGSGQEPVPTTPDSVASTTNGTGPATTPPRDTTTTSRGPAATVGPTTTTTLAPLQSLAYEEVGNLEFPVEMVALPDSDLAYIATKDGRVWAFDGSSVLETPVLDINDQVRNDGEQGFLSIAIHPEETSRLFAHYSDDNGDTVVSEFAFYSPTQADPGSERVLLTVDQPAGNHNGGMIDVRDGDLFLGLGDGGGAGDRFGNGQNTETLLGGLVRIPLDGSAAMLWQYGLRNPWRFWFDGDLIYIADVGQNAFEEVNYGWPITEALHCYSPSSGCDTEGLTLPVIEVAHGDSGTCSITGGVVYRGSAIPEVDGHYFYSDFCGGYLRSFAYQDGGVVEETDWTDQVGGAGSVPGFGIDGAGEMYVMTTGSVLRVVAVRG